MLIVMDNNELVDSSILYNHAMDNCEHIDTSAEDDNVNCCKKEFFPASSVSVFFRQIVLHKNLALVVDICGEHLLKMGKLFSFFCTHANPLVKEIIEFNHLICTFFGTTNYLLYNYHILSTCKISHEFVVGM